MVLRKEITIKAPAHQVFTYWADFRNFQHFIPMIESITIIDASRSRWIINAPLGHKVVFNSIITTHEPDKVLAWESRHDDGFARGELRLYQEDKHTRVVLDFEYRLYRHWMRNIARLVGHFGFPSTAFDRGLARIKAKIETDAANEAGWGLPNKN